MSACTYICCVRYENIKTMDTIHIRRTGYRCQYKLFNSKHKGHCRTHEILPCFHWISFDCLVSMSSVNTVFRTNPPTKSPLSRRLFERTRTRHILYTHLLYAIYIKFYFYNRHYAPVLLPLLIFDKFV